MNGNRYALRLTKIFSLCFAALFMLLGFSIIVSGYEHEKNVNTYNCSALKHYIIIFSAAAVTALLIITYHCVQNAGRRLGGDKTLRYRYIVFAVIAVMFIVQLVTAYLLMFDAVTDVGIIKRYAYSYARHGNFGRIARKLRHGDVYLIRYPNNLAITFLLSGVFRLWYIITGEVSDAPAIVLNVIAINSSVFMTVMLSRRIMGERRSLFVLMLCAVFAPFYTYTSYYYTDSLSMPFVVGAVYILISALDTDGRRRLLMLFACGVVLLLGFKLKGSLVIVLVGAVVYVILKLSFKKMVCALLALLLGFTATYAAWTGVYRASGIITAEQSYEYEYPPTHWVMMGLRGYGNYHPGDSRYTQSFSGKDAKNAADMRVIKRRLKKMGVSGLVSHLGKKAVWTWEDGTYFISHHIAEAKNRNFLHELVVQNGRYHFPFYAYSCGIQIFLIFMMALSAVRSARRREIDAMTLMQGLVFGLFVFLLVWETRSRYLYNFTPIFILLSADGTGEAIRIIKRLRNK